MNKPEEIASGRPVLPPASTGSQTIDIEKLAEKVYQLMHADTRLQRARGVTRGTRR